MMIRLSYRELADRLGCTPDAARMKAKRMAAQNKWRVIPGNHPQDKVYIELPEEDLPAEPPPPPSPPAAEPPPPEPPANSLAESALAMVAEAHQRVAVLTDQVIAAKNDLLAEKDAHRLTAEQLAAKDGELATLRAELEAASAKLEEAWKPTRKWQPGRWRK